MLDDVSVSIRATLVKARIEAMTRGRDAACSLLDETLRSPDITVCDRLGLLMLKMECTYLDWMITESYSLYGAAIAPLLNELPPHQAVLLADNGTLVANSVLLGLDEFYQLADQRQLLNLPLADIESERDISDALRDSKHFEALPACWHALTAAYHSFLWRRIWVAEHEMARECLALGWPHEAAYHAMLAMDDELVQSIAHSVAAMRQPHEVARVIEKVICCSLLARHAASVATLLAEFADVLPDTLVPPVMEWLSARTSYVPIVFLNAQLFTALWRAIRELAPRLNSDQSLILARAVIQHPWFNARDNVHRQHLIDALNALVERVDQAYLPEIANQALCLATDTKSDADYTKAINLLTHLSVRADDAVRTALRDRLFPSGANVDVIRLQVAKHFGANLTDSDAHNRLAPRVAALIMKQVEKIPKDGTPTTMGAVGTIRKDTDTEAIIVHINGALNALAGVISHVELLSGESRSELLNATLAMASNATNIVANRCGLLANIRKMLKYVSKDQALLIATCVRQLASHAIVESDVGMTYAEAVNPLNPFKMNTGDPADLHGMALLLLAEVTAAHPEASDVADESLLLAAMSDPSPTVRSYAFRAARELKTLSNEQRIAALSSSGDSDPSVAATALSVFLTPRDTEGDATVMLMLIGALQRCQASPATSVRRMAARVTEVLARRELPEPAKSRVAAIQARFKSDECYSVRRLALETN